MMKNALLILLGSVIPVALAGAGFFYIKISLPDETWTHENQNMLYESFSPNHQRKLGVYNYDIGALGYTAVQVSVVDAAEPYPLSGNLLRDRYVESVNWLSDNKVEFSLHNESKLKARVMIQLD
jgi:hypothetical protein